MPRPLRQSRISILLALIAGLTFATSACSGLAGNGVGAGEAGAGREAVMDASSARIEVPSDPKRVVVLGERDLEGVLALDVQPVGFVSEGGLEELPDHLADKLGPKATAVGEPGDSKPGRIAELKPDLILAGSLSKQKTLRRLRKITPATVVTTKPEEPWQTTFGRIALVLGKQRKGEKLLEAYDRKVQAARKALDSYAGAAASIVQWDAEKPRYLLHDATASLVLRDLGFTRPEPQQQPAGTSLSDPLDPEELKPLDAELMFLMPADPQTEKVLARAQEDSDFRQLSVVRRENVVAVDAEAWGAAGGPITADLITDAVLDGLGESIEPEGSTETGDPDESGSTPSQESDRTSESE